MGGEILILIFHFAQKGCVCVCEQITNKLILASYIKYFPVAFVSFELLNAILYYRYNFLSIGGGNFKISENDMIARPRIIYSKLKYNMHGNEKIKDVIVKIKICTFLYYILLKEYPSIIIYNKYN